MNIVINMYVTLLPVILSGVLTMIICKLPIMKSINRPIDGGRYLKDGRRLFGDNKTWKGACAYLLTGLLSTTLLGAIASISQGFSQHNYFYMNHNNTWWYNCLIGLLLGVAYALFELPNSFMKRRIGIEPGVTLKGAKKVFFVFIDQADSIIGCALVVWLFYDIGIVVYLLFILVGAGTHIVINILLYMMHLRKNMF